MLVLGIETSCDETSAAVVENGRRVRSNVIASSLALHRRYGGVVPEIACRAHVESIAPVTHEALARAGVRLDEIDLLAVTRGPGLVGALLVGVTFAQGLRLLTNTPLIGVSHLAAHLYGGFMQEPRLRFPCVGLIVSGGHTVLVHARDAVTFRRLGETVDDAAGEAFDKVAHMLHLGYPGGPRVEARATKGDPTAIRLPHPRMNRLDFSFSGLKTAVLHEVRRHPRLPSRYVADVCASFQRVVVAALVQQSLAACRRTRSRWLVVGGGVAANRHLRSELTAACRREGMQAVFPPLSLCLDNAAMVAGLGYAMARRRPSTWPVTWKGRAALDVDPNLLFN